MAERSETRRHRAGFFAGFARVIWQNLARLALAALVLLALYGVLPQARVAILLVLFVLGRGAFVLYEALQSPATEADWEALRAELAQAYAGLGQDELEREARHLGLEGDGPFSGPQLADAVLAERRRSYRPPRSGGELACEGLGLLAFGLLIPADAMLYSRDFVSFRLGLGWVGVAVATASVALYAWPLWWPGSVRWRGRRMFWWAGPFLPALVLLVLGIAVRHPYLDPTREDRSRLAAERVLALPNNVVAGAHADWVFDHARTLVIEGDLQGAIHFYQRGLRVDPTNPEAQARLAGLTAGRRPTSNDLSAAERARRPLWEEGKVAAPVKPCAIDPGLARLGRTTVVLVPVGPVPDWLAHAIGEVLGAELSIPVCLSSSTVPLPAHTRVRGLLVGRQWSDRSLVEAFARELPQLPEMTHRYLLLTGADIYFGETNFIFSSAFPWGAVISYARYGDPDTDRLWIVRRTAKQALGALIKSVGVPPSTDPNCVTSYSNGLAQFDAKGNRPTVETLAHFHAALHRLDAPRPPHDPS